jgi:hypothetical protein
MSQDILRRAFNDICIGHSSGKVLDRPAVVKHLCHSDQLGLETLEAEYYDLAKSRGLPTEKDRLALIKREGRWKDSDDKELDRLKLSIDSLVAGRKNATLPSILESVNKQIDEERERYNKKWRERTDLLALTCEVYSQRRVNEYYIFKNLYKEASFSELLFSEEEFNDLSEPDMNRVIRDYNIVMEPCSDDNIKKLSIQEFFQSYYFIAGDDFSSFYGKPIWRLTLFQVRLANYAKYFKSIFENYDMRNVPKEIMENPDKIADWVQATERTKKELEKQGDAPAGGVAGMTAKDRKAVGLQNDSVDLAKEAKKSGGTLNMQQLMRIMGKT